MVSDRRTGREGCRPRRFGPLRRCPRPGTAAPDGDGLRSPGLPEASEFGDHGSRLGYADRATERVGPQPMVPGSGGVTDGRMTSARPGCIGCPLMARGVRRAIGTQRLSFRVQPPTTLVDLAEAMATTPGSRPGSSAASRIIRRRPGASAANLRQRQQGGARQGEVMAATFTGSDDLQGAEFVNTDLRGARFRGSDLPSRPLCLSWPVTQTPACPEPHSID